MAKKNKNDVENIKEKRRPNWLLRITILVILIPCIIVGVVLISSIDKSGKPVVGNRFDDELVNKITEEDLSKVESSLQNLKKTENISVSMQSATVRILIDCKDGISKDNLKEVGLKAYDKTVKILPVKKYFKNLKDDQGNVVKMYDLEVHAYNTVDEESSVKPLHLVISRNAPADGRTVVWASNIKNKEVKKEVDGNKKKG